MMIIIIVVVVARRGQVEISADEIATGILDGILDMVVPPAEKPAVKFRGEIRPFMISSLLDTLGKVPHPTEYKDQITFVSLN